MNYKIITVLLIVILLNSCTKNKVDTSISMGGTVIFNINGITEFDKISYSKSNNTHPNKTKNNLLTINSEFEALTTAYTTDPKTNKNLDKQGVTKLPENVTYRIELFKVVGGTEQHVRTINRVSGTSNSMSDSVGVQYNNTYKWYAYSYNDTQTIANANGSVEIPMGANKDFLYTNGTFVVDFYNNKQINLLFTRKTAQIQIEFDGRGVNADEFNSLNIVLPDGLVKTANFNLKDNTIIGTPTNVPLTTLSLSSFSDVNGTSYRKASGYYHTVAPQTNPSISTTGISFTVRNEFAPRPLSSLRNIGSINTPVTFSFDTSIEVGKSTALKVDLLESGLKYTTSTGTVEFARSNLYRHESGGDHRYRFYPENIQAQDPRSYFSFKGHIPLALTERTGSKDPCALVYPAGRWKTATLSEINTQDQPLVGTTGILSNLLGSLVSLLLTGNNPNYMNLYQSTTQSLNSSYLDYTNYSGVSNSQFSLISNQLAFPLNGEHIVADLVNIGSLSVVSLNLGTTYNTRASLWTRQSTLDIPLIGFGLGGWSYYGVHTEIVLVPLTPAVERQYAFGTPFLLAEVTLLGFNVLSSDYKNIRCTRDVTWLTTSTQAQREPNYD